MLRIKTSSWTSWRHRDCVFASPRPTRALERLQWQNIVELQASQGTYTYPGFLCFGFVSKSCFHFFSAIVASHRDTCRKGEENNCLFMEAFDSMNCVCAMINILICLRLCEAVRPSLSILSELFTLSQLSQLQTEIKAKLFANDTRQIYFLLWLNHFYLTSTASIMRQT